MTCEWCTQFLESKAFDSELISNAFVGGLTGALTAIGILFLIVFLAAIYVYSSYAWMIIARKLKYKKAWLAWIPIANGAMILQLGGFHWAWIFLILIPILGWIALFVLAIIATWRIFEKRKYPGWFSLSMIVPRAGGILYLIAIGFVAFQDKIRKRKR
ncbi:MAG: hypothetical protein KKF48_03640 [Nanoarchaeota archaeon]|nr:hypothetical protein [Nanoarchaeota archaeon]MBU1028112.1 hypothetical protein [Nanoarchaeota archaeon]